MVEVRLESIRFEKKRRGNVAECFIPEMQNSKCEMRRLSVSSTLSKLIAAWFYLCYSACQGGSMSVSEQMYTYPYLNPSTVN